MSKGSRFIPAAALLLVLLVACSAGASSTPTPTGHPIKVLFTLSGTYDDVGGTATDCFGKGGYSDFKTGLQATVKDASGSIVGFAPFATSQGGNAPGQRTPAPISNCTLEANVPNVPYQDIYTIEVGRRGSINYSRSDLEAKDWTVELSLGD